MNVSTSDVTPSRKQNRSRNKYGKKRGIFYLVSAIAVSALLFVGFYLYSYNFLGYLYNSGRKTFHEIILQQKFNIDSAIEAKISLLDNLALSFSYLPDDRSVVLKLLEELGDNSEFNSLAISSLRGKGITHDGSLIDISMHDDLPRVLAGETVLSAPVQAPDGNGTVFSIAAPVTQNGKMPGILIGSLTSKDLESLILPAFDGKVYCFVVNSQGDIMFSIRNAYTLSDKENIFQTLKSLEFTQDNSYDQLVAHIATGVSGTVSYGTGSQLRFAEYMPLDINDWSIVLAVPMEVISPDTVSITQSTSWLILLVILLFGLLIFYIMFQQSQNTKALEQLAYFDDFSGAPTLAKFKQEASRFIAETSDKKHLMVKFDIAQFKLVNQILGDEIGDIAIKNIAKALEANTPGKYKRYARLHDDEFLVLHVYDEVEELLEIRDRFQTMFYQFMGPGFQYNIKMISGHYYMSLENCTDVTEAIEKANIAHRRAKRTGQEICVYDHSFVEESLKQKAIEIKMRTALQNNEFKVYLQPKYALENVRIVGAEALVRWVTAQGEMIYPNDFIPIFEQNGFIIDLDFYMFECSCKILHGWISQGQIPVPISVNFSRLHTFNTDFAQFLCGLADQYQVPHHLLEVELTESIMFDNENAIQAVLQELHNCGFTLSMDDFGAGYSSLGLLKNLPVDILKIDRSFFSYEKDEQRGKLIIESIMQLAKKLRIYTVAEGVELQEHIDLLREVGCDYVQGYYFARPMPAQDFFKQQPQPAAAAN